MSGMSTDYGIDRRHDVESEPEPYRGGAVPVDRMLTPREAGRLNDVDRDAVATATREINEALLRGPLSDGHDMSLKVVVRLPSRLWSVMKLRLEKAGWRVGDASFQTPYCTFWVEWSGE